MHFALTEEQRMIQQLAREFAQQEIAPLSAQHDREQSFPLPVHAKALELGLLNIAMPAEFGGAGLDVMEDGLTLAEALRSREYADVKSAYITGAEMTGRIIAAPC